MTTYEQLQKAIEENGGVGCEQAAEAFFFEEESKDPNMQYKRELAKKICGDCPVRMLCLEYALESSEEFGIWGGLTRSERRQLKRERRIGEVIHRGNSRRAEGQRLRIAS